MEITEISERIKQMIDYIGVKPNEFATKLQYKRSQAIYDMLNGKAKPSFDFFQKLLDSEYSEIFDLHWIITGKGDMLQNIEKMIVDCPHPIRDELLLTKQDLIDSLKEQVSLLKEQNYQLKKANKPPFAIGHVAENPGNFELKKPKK